ncbi:LysR family transcriptional regulator [Nocardia stercoris]|uniref:LysR family transcriptional regulator n=1 Tax=Nocardia stercoris TaxID=2483361 RepID=A0A3M2KZ24_9NOCA|nr:LysR family transcriptional regulator [Nocardia stercoris]RMI29690.1 LysR family transcriptional regulator [Nocardia stercoris]
MEIRQIECFLACCDQRSFTAAARALNLVQSAVSTSVAKLERELGTRLFDRTPRALELTEAGQAMVQPARALLRARAGILDAVDTTRLQVRGEVVVGSLMNVRNLDMATVIAELHRRHPGVTVQMRQSTIGMTGNIAGVRDGSLDVALLAGTGESWPGLCVHRILTDELVLCTAPGHPLADRPFRPDDLDGERFVDFPPGWGLRSLADARFPGRRPVIEVPDQLFALQLAAKDFGVTLLERSVAGHAPEPIAVVAAEQPLIWHLSVGHDPQRTLSNAARAFVATITGSRGPLACGS